MSTLDMQRKTKIFYYKKENNLFFSTESATRRYSTQIDANRRYSTQLHIFPSASRQLFYIIRLWPQPVKIPGKDTDFFCGSAKKWQYYRCCP
jgi:hypothetical protein